MDSAGRIIPAYAGSTTAGTPWPTTPADHPRVRGEHHAAVSGLEVARGSSPRTRGAPTSSTRLSFRPRIIPAYAGSTSTAPRSSRSSWDHPRVRGEHTPWMVCPLYAAGSSPRTRGAPVDRAVVPARTGIIPAYAGSTFGLREQDQADRDHPRVRGEHHLEPPHVFCLPGSSPRTRGAHIEDSDLVRCEGIIPAYAGSTCVARGRGSRRRDHPRVRGEHCGRKYGLRYGSGSSPRTRGARATCTSARAQTGIIPAYAGSTPRSRRRCR